MASGHISLKVKLLDQSCHDLNVDPNTLISDLKCLLEAVVNVPINRQRLIYRGRVLRDESTLQELGVANGHTIHLVERPADAPDPASQTAASQPANPQSDFNRLLSGVFSALTGAGAAQPSATPQASADGAAAGAAAAAPPPPHLLQSITDFLQQLSDPARANFLVMPVTSLAPGLPPAGAADAAQLQQSLLAAVQQVLQGQQLTSAQQDQLQQAQAGSAATAMPTQLVLAALSVLLDQARSHVTGALAASLDTAAQQLCHIARQEGQPGAAAHEALTHISGQLQAAAALLVELARAASAASLGVQGNTIALTSNTAAVLRQSAGGGLEPAFPTLYPQTSSRPGHASAEAPVQLPDFSNPAQVMQVASSIANQFLGGAAAAPPASGATGDSSRAAAAATMPTAAAAQGAAPSGQQVAQMVASALTSSLAPVIQRVSTDVAGAVRAGREQIASGQFQATAAATSEHVSCTVARVLGQVTEAINSNVRAIEQQLRQVEQEGGREANTYDIANVVQQVLLPHMQPLGDAISAAARGAATSSAAATAAAQAAAAAGRQAANATAAAAATPAATATGPTAAEAPVAATPAVAAAAPSSSSIGGGSQPRGLGPGLKSGSLPAKRKAAGASTGSDNSGLGGQSSAAAPPGMGHTSGGAPAGQAQGTSGAGGGTGSADARRVHARTPASEAGSAGPAGTGRPAPDMSALMQMMGGMLSGGGVAGGTATVASSAGGAGNTQRAAAGPAPDAAGAAGTRAAVPAAGRGGDLNGLMQIMGGMLGGGAAPGGAGGMNGLLQMAGQIASDPAMQPLLSNMANSVLGGSAAGGAAAGGGSGMGGLGSLLSGLLGGTPPGSAAGNTGRGGAASATVIVDENTLEHELPADMVADWRRMLEQDARAQAAQQARGQGQLSEVYQAGAPIKRQGLLSRT